MPRVKCIEELSSKKKVDYLLQALEVQQHCMREMFQMFLNKALDSEDEEFGQAIARLGTKFVAVSDTLIQETINKHNGDNRIIVP